MNIFDKFNRQSTPAAKRPTTTEALLAFFKANNCRFEAEPKSQDNYDRYTFDFQGGHFIALIYKDFEGVEVIYPRIQDCDIEQLNVVRSLCNFHTSASAFYKFYYQVQDKKPQVDVNISFFANVLEPQSFIALLEGVFEAQRGYIDTFGKALTPEASGTNGPTSDPERSKAAGTRELFLMKQQELSHQLPVGKWRTSDTEKLPLKEFMATLLLRDDLQLLGINLDGRTVSAGLDTYDLLAPLRNLDATGTDDAFKPWATAFVTYECSREPGLGQRIMPIIWRYEGFDGGTHYVRVNAFQEPEALGRDNAANGDEGDMRPQSFTVLVAHDTKSPEKKLQEFRFMWQDAKDKIRDGQQNQLTDEQQLIYDIQEPNIAYNIYWGRSAMNHKRYYEALRFFRNAFSSLRLKYFGLSRQERQVFFDICYYIGFCYCDLQLYELAYFYLDYVESLGRIDYSMEYVNALANSSDLRVFRAIHDIQGDLQEQWEGDDDVPENVKRLSDFLRRRQAYSYINFGNLDEAEKSFKSMLDEPDNRDYAIHELAYIQQLRRENAQTDAKKSTKKDNENKDIENQNNGNNP